MKKILYLCPELPGGTNTGGVQAHKYFIEQFASACFDRLVVVGISRELQTDICQPVYTLFKVTPTIVGGRFGAIISKIWRQLRNLQAPNKITCRQSAKGLALTKSLLAGGDIELVVVDHFDALSLVGIDYLRNCGIPILYIAHNFEYGLIRDLVALAPASSLKKWVLRLELFRTGRLERQLLQLASKVIFLSSYDAVSAEQFGPIAKKYTHIPANFNLLIDSSQPESRSGKLLFSCNFGFAPNREALRWIALELAPELDPSITIVVTGVDENQVPCSWKHSNLCYMGYLEKSEFATVFDSVDAFLCPIEYGSGIKMKIIEALLAGLPVFACANSWRGLEGVSEGYVISRNPQKAASCIFSIFQSNANLRAMGIEMSERFGCILKNQMGVREIIDRIGLDK